MSPVSPKRVILAAGGTGGHMFPAQALARELLARDLGVTLITDRRGGGFGPDLPQVDTRFISAGGLAGRGPIQKLRGALRQIAHLGGDHAQSFEIGVAYHRSDQSPVAGHRHADVHAIVISNDRVHERRGHGLCGILLPPRSAPAGGPL